MRKIFLTVAILLFVFPTQALAAPPQPCRDTASCPSGYTCAAGVNLPQHDSGTKYCYNISTMTTAEPLGARGCFSDTELETALGCIPTNTAGFVVWILKNAILMGGGIAFLLSIFGGATILMSGGNPEGINHGREIITSAISGLLFIVLSIFLLRLVGVDILGLPGFVR